MFNFLFQVIYLSFIQIFAIFGIFFLLGFILTEIQKFTLKNYSSSIGWRGILWTAWLGTPVHEYSHAFFALLFKHKIIDIALFSPQPNTGELGHVNHSYNKRNIYQNLGNFFIGLAPLIFGPIVLVLLLYILVPQGREIFAQLPEGQISISIFFVNLKKFFTLLFSTHNLKSWSFWIFLYISFAISSHLAPSRSDLRGASKGAVVILIIIFIINIFALLIHWDFSTYVFKFSHFLEGLIAVYSYVLIISLIHYLLSLIILCPWRHKKGLNV